MNFRFRLISLALATAICAQPASAEFMLAPTQAHAKGVRVVSIIVSDQGKGVALIDGDVVAFAHGQRQRTVATVPGRVEATTVLHSQEILSLHYKPQGALRSRTMLLDASGTRIALADRPDVLDVIDYEPSSGIAVTLETADSEQMVIALVDRHGTRLTETRAFSLREGADMPRARIAADASAAIICLEPLDLASGRATLLDARRRERRDIDFSTPLEDCAIEGNSLIGLAGSKKVIRLDRSGGDRGMEEAQSPALGFRQSTQGRVVLRRGLADVPSRRPSRRMLHGLLEQMEPPVLGADGKLSVHGRFLSEVPAEAAGDIAVRFSAADRFGERGVLAFLDDYRLAVNISPSGETQWFDWSADVAFSPMLNFAAVRRGNEIDVIPADELHLNNDEVSRRISSRWTEMMQPGLR